jgi:glycosyltransferase involved in cell wall biosynthesis
MADSPRISVVTPTLRRPADVAEMLDDLSKQTILPYELVLVDGAPAGEEETSEVVQKRIATLNYRVEYIRSGGGTAIQRNTGIDRATGNFIAFIDDDIRLAPDFFERIVELYESDTAIRIGGVAGYITNQYLNAQTSPRWRWYRRLRLFRTYEPGRYDFETGYPINRYLQPPHDRIREIDFMGSNCALWRREVFDAGLRFSEFFVDYGVLEDAHLALRARRTWKLLECGSARCIHLRSPSGRLDKRRLTRKSAVNYRFVFIDIVRSRTWKQECRFWRVQLVDLLNICVHALKTGAKEDWLGAVGKIEGIITAVRLNTPKHTE